MDAALRRRMFAYYDKRAPDYEEAYTRGVGTASIADPSIFTTEAERLAGVVRSFGSGHLIDLACGSGYWLPHYAPRCASMTLIDQSANMLGECRAKVRTLGMHDKCTLVQGDVLEYAFQPAAYDSALVGFLISHLTEEQERQLFESLARMLQPGGRFLILDSAWTELRARFNAKTETQTRRLNDGEEFGVYKRYLDRLDIAKWKSLYGAMTDVEYFGEALFAVSGRFTR